MGIESFLARTSGQTIEALERYRAHLVVMECPRRRGVLNEQVTFAAFHREESTCICYSETFLAQGLITLAKWVGVTRPVSAVVEEAMACRTRLKA